MGPQFPLDQLQIIVRRSSFLVNAGFSIDQLEVPLSLFFFRLSGHHAWYLALSSLSLLLPLLLVLLHRPYPHCFFFIVHVVVVAVIVAVVVMVVVFTVLNHVLMSLLLSLLLVAMS